MMWCGGIHIPCSLFLIGLLPRNKEMYSIMTMSIAMMMNLLNGIMVIRNARSKKQK